MNRSRRDLLRALAVAGGVGVTGCLGGANDPQTQSSDAMPTTTRGQQEPSGPPTRTDTTVSPSQAETTASPTRTWGNCTASPPRPDESQLSVQPSEYPDFPSSIEVAQAKEFALAFDQAYQRNEYIVQEHRDEGPDPSTVNISDQDVVRTVDIEQGVVIGINGRLTAESEPVVTTEDEETVTDRRETDLQYGSWYHVLSDRLRHMELSDQISGESDRPPLTQLWTVYCR